MRVGCDVCGLTLLFHVDFETLYAGLLEGIMWHRINSSMVRLVLQKRWKKNNTGKSKKKQKSEKFEKFEKSEKFKS